MRNRTVDSNTALEATASPKTVDHWFITEKGLRASGAASMMASAASLRQAATELEQAASRLNQEAPPPPPNDSGIMAPLDFRRVTVCGRYRHESRVPDLRLSGKWLRSAGFDLGQKVQVQVGDGQLMICAE